MLHKTYALLPPPPWMPPLLLAINQVRTKVNPGICHPTWKVPPHMKLSPTPQRHATPHWCTPYSPLCSYGNSGSEVPWPLGPNLSLPLSNGISGNYGILLWSDVSGFLFVHHIQRPKQLLSLSEPFSSEIFLLKRDLRPDIFKKNQRGLLTSRLQRLLSPSTFHATFFEIFSSRILEEFVSKVVFKIEIDQKIWHRRKNSKLQTGSLFGWSAGLSPGFALSFAKQL